MINLNKSYEGALTAILIVVTMAWMTAPAEAHPSVVVDVPNLKGIVKQLCTQIVQQAVTMDDLEQEEAQAMYSACVEYSIAEMYAVPHVHIHS